MWNKYHVRTIFKIIPNHIIWLFQWSFKHLQRAWTWNDNLSISPRLPQTGLLQFDQEALWLSLKPSKICLRWSSEWAKGYHLSERYVLNFQTDQLISTSFQYLIRRKWNPWIYIWMQKNSRKLSYWKRSNSHFCNVAKNRRFRF